MTSTQAKVSPPRIHNWWKIIRRTLTIIAVAFLIGLVVHQISSVLERSPRPAGFLRGMLQGALMPCALPNLLVGHDVIIYAQNNTGVGYKLGYTLGVNVCGAFFFGMFFLRLSRWRKQMNGAGRSAECNAAPPPASLLANPAH